MQLRKKLMNSYEASTNEILQRIVTTYGATVFPKVRVADVLEIKGSGISDDLYKYALMAHFDFVIADKNTEALFAVEFDGPHHSENTEAIANDHKKNVICERLGLPLLRIDGDFLNRTFRRFTLLSWLTELWFLEQAFYTAQEAGQVPFDEPFMYSLILSDSIDLVHPENIKITFPYDLAYPARRLMIDSYAKGVCKHEIPEIYTLVPEDGYIESIALLPITDDTVLVGKARCRIFHFSPVVPSEACEDLAVFDLGEKLKNYRQGKYKAQTTDYTKSLIQTLKSAAVTRKARLIQNGLAWDR